MKHAIAPANTPCSQHDVRLSGWCWPPVKFQAISGWIACGFLAGLLVATPLAAAEPESASVYPLGCQLGASVEITCAGTGIGKGSVLHFSQAGISVEHLADARFRVSAPADIPEGDCELWVATSNALLGPHRFALSPHARLTEQEENDTRSDAQPIVIPITVDGRFDKAADLDWFAFEGQSKQRITITCRSRSLDGSGLPSLTLVDPQGRELVHSAADEAEPRIAYRLATTGTYRLLVHDRAYRHDNFSFYQLDVVEESADERAVPAGSSVIGPADLFGSVPPKNEQASTRQEPQTVSLPCRIAGRFDTRDDIDWFRFEGQQDQVVYVEAFGERLGQWMDLDAAIFDSAGKLLATAPDVVAPQGIPTGGQFGALPLASLDPALEVRLPAAGEYRVCLRDLYGGSVFGPRRRYQLVVTAREPGFFAVAMPANGKRSQGMFVKRGDKAALSVLVVRARGFDAAVEIRAAKAPQGIMIARGRVDAKQVTTPIEIAVAPDASPGFYTLQLVAEADVDSASQAQPVVNTMQIHTGAIRRIDEFVVYISE